MTVPSGFPLHGTVQLLETAVPLSVLFEAKGMVPGAPMKPGFGLLTAVDEGAELATVDAATGMVAVDEGAEPVAVTAEVIDT